MSATRGLLADVLRFSCVDGPGNRFVAFFQGCNFNCIACHNPYTINVCTNCGDCIDACPSGALSFDLDRVVQWDDAVCTGAERCIEVCTYDSTPKARWTPVDELVAHVRRVAPFLSGVTASGGEATQQAEFLYDWFVALKADPVLGKLTTFVDSNGAAAPSVWNRLAPVLDGAMIDLKCLDPLRHEEMTGHPNAAVLASIEQLAALGKLYEVRLLVLPGVNDDADLLARTGAWLHAVDPHVRVKVIGFRCHGVRLPSRLPREPTPAEMRDYEVVLRDAGLCEIALV